MKSVKSFRTASALAICIAVTLGLGPSFARADVVVHEVLANNVSAFENDGTYPDYVELYNNGPADVNLGDWSLTDNVLNQPRKFVFEPGTIIQSGGFLLVFCDDATNSPGIHTRFTFKNTGEEVGLFQSLALGGGLVSSNVFGPQIPDMSFGRYPTSTNGFRLNVPTPLASNVVAGVVASTSLWINEWMANPAGGEDWFEIYNPEATPVNIANWVFTDRDVFPITNRPMPLLSFIAPGGFLQFFASDLSSRDRDHVDFKLGNSGDRILMYTSTSGAVLVDRVDFGPQTNNISQGRLPDGNPGTNYVYFPSGKSTPAASNFQPFTNVFINELLAHTDPPLEDAIELYNPTDTEVNIGQFWLSNSRDDPKKFRIPAGTKIPPFGFKVFYEYAGLPGGFNTNGQGTNRSFTMNAAHGDDIYLFSAATDAGGTLTGFRASRTIGPSENGVSWGRYVTSEDKTDFVPMASRTFGQDNPTDVSQFRMGTGRTNSYPKIGPLIINEIMYHPPDIITSFPILITNDNSLDEYIEILNIANTITYLYDTNYPTNTWRLRGGTDYDFPTNISLNAGAYLLAVNFDPRTNLTQLAAFRSLYSVPAGVQIFGPYRGKLSNSGGTVELDKPDPVQLPPHPDAGFVPYILVERVEYNDKSPWPEGPDGDGTALHRIVPEQYSNDPINWSPGPPTPGRQSIRISSSQYDGDNFTLRFRAAPSASYSVIYRNTLGGTNWTRLTNIAAQATSGNRTATDLNVGSRTSRYYQVVSPALP